MYDELIGLLEAIHEAQTDGELKRRARDAVTHADFDQRRGVKTWRSDAGPEKLEWSVRSARRAVRQTKSRVERDIAEAKETLAKIGGRG